MSAQKLKCSVYIYSHRLWVVERIIYKPREHCEFQVCCQKLAHMNAPACTQIIYVFFYRKRLCWPKMYLDKQWYAHITSLYCIYAYKIRMFLLFDSLILC